MPRPTCSPRAENLLDIARQALTAGRLEADLAARFRGSLAEPPQRGTQDFGMGLCGRKGSRLARNLGEVNCAECLQLLGQEAT